LGSAITDLLAAGPAPSWSGTATGLLKALVDRTPVHLRKHLPATPAALGQKLRRLMPDLKALGVEVELDLREGHDSTRMISLRCAESAVRAVGADRCDIDRALRVLVREVGTRNSAVAVEPWRAAMNVGERWPISDPAFRSILRHLEEIGHV